MRANNQRLVFRPEIRFRDSSDPADKSRSRQHAARETHRRRKLEKARKLLETPTQRRELTHQEMEEDPEKRVRVRSEPAPDLNKQLQNLFDLFPFRVSNEQQELMHHCKF